MCVVHVDDMLVGATAEFLDWLAWKMEEKFGKPKRMTMPLIFVGIRHRRLSQHHVLLDQGHYVEKLKPVKMDRARLKHDTSSLQAAEHTEFLSLIHI